MDGPLPCIHTFDHERRLHQANSRERCAAIQCYSSAVVPARLRMRSMRTAAHAISTLMLSDNDKEGYLECYSRPQN